jgi:hypothetical protein
MQQKLTGESLLSQLAGFLLDTRGKLEQQAALSRRGLAGIHDPLSDCFLIAHTKRSATALGSGGFYEP